MIRYYDQPLFNFHITFIYYTLEFQLNLRTVRSRPVTVNSLVYIDNKAFL